MEAREHSTPSLSASVISAYLVEVAPRSGNVAGALSAKARESAGDARFLRSIYVPEDDRWFLLYEAGSAEAVTAAAERADVELLSIGPAYTIVREGNT